ncbi:HD domain-containing protein [Hydrogenimonas sp.]|uniref:HD domain-containing protein n=1 Tax=Hydrogenimonas sp. TaxID=2231112 RepID=UPI002615E0F2|nr:HD domain-containing protein [Hydrogenimonas sp.]
MIPNTDLFHKALRLAAWAHYGQVTKFGDPYITHPTAASYELLAAQSAGEVFDVDLAVITALLHDVVEKSDVTLKSIRKDFGQAVAAGVAAMTKNESLPKNEQLRDSVTRILDQPREIAMAKIADRISSMLPISSEWSDEKITTILGNAEMILQVLGDASPYLKNRLKRKIRLYRNVLEKRQ